MRTSKATATTAKQSKKPLLQLLEAAPNKGQGSIMAAALLKKFGGEKKEAREEAWRNAKPKDIVTLRERDKSLGNKRGDNQPFFLSVSGQRVLYALARIISKDRNAPDISAAIASPYSKVQVVRKVNVSDLAQIIHGDTRKKYREEVFKALQNLEQTYQLFTTKRDGVVYFKISSIIKFDELEGKIQDGDTFVEEVSIIFNHIFFEGLGKHYAYIPDKVFETFRKNRTALYATLFSTLNGVYWGHWGAAQKARRKARSEAMENAKMGITTTEEELCRTQEEAAREAMKVELLAATIKEKMGGKKVTDYESTREQRRRFRQDLSRAVADLKELGLIKEERWVEGTDKIIFYLFENYSRNAEVIGDLAE